MVRRLTLASFFLLLGPSVSLAAGRAIEQAIDALRTSAPGAADVVISSVTGSVTFFAPESSTGVPVPDSTSRSPEARALSFLAVYGDAFGLHSASDMDLNRSVRDELGMDHVRYRQLHQGIPVTGGELIVHLRDGAVLAVNGKTVTDLDGVAVAPATTANDALASASGILRKHLQIEDAEFSTPRLEIFNRGLLEGRPSPTRLAWFIEATRPDLREYIWVDAATGTVLLHFNQRPEAKNRAVYDANDSSSLPGTLVRSEGGAATGDADADKAYSYSGATYDYYWTQHGRDSFDNSGGQLRSSVHFCPSPAACPYPNAYWDSSRSQMVYGTGFASGDDVVAHEITHAVTDRTADLFYYMQSGALNESFSDIFGETVDLTDGLGNDTSGVRWLMGEDIPGGAGRNMMTPTAYGDPGKTSDPEFKCYFNGLYDDRGGVHSNSGVPNHAYALMTDGGSYNGHTITTIGLAKAGKIEYRALTQYLVSASDFLETSSVLYRSCMDLIGTSGITGADCSQVSNALAAVEMNEALPCFPTPAATPLLCPVGKAPTIWSSVDFETSLGFPACPSGTPPTAWCDNGPSSILGSFATSGTHSLWGYNFPTAGDRSTGLTWGSALLPANAKLQFNHSYGFEDDLSANYDGGVVEYSINGGSSWLDAAPLFAAGATYFGPIDNCCGNPLAGRNAFVGESWGYTATQLNLASLAGKTFAIRFRIGTDADLDEMGWFVDDLEIYQCFNDPRIFADDFESGGWGTWSSIAP